ncbi:MAG: FKBP-type peptidyl-prolyl cis-trans isomerase [Candidatus ainarchaeum sp.]|nr:FKBP-type peptidyl-prolyl cis-trans isomerase [Candidatus ainarchaeum sp.]
MISTKYILLLMLPAILLMGCNQPAPPAPQPNKTLAIGDQALADYILMVDVLNQTTGVTQSVVYDTSIQSVAQASGIYNAQRTYQPLLVSMDYNGTTLPGFVRGIVGMQEGENRTFVLSSAEAYGPVDPTKIVSIDKVYTVSRFENVPVTYFQSRNLTYAPGTPLSNGVWNAEVVNSTNSSVLVRYLPQENQTFTFNGIPEQVLNFTGENITLNILAQKGMVFSTTSPTGAALNARVIAVNETTVTLDSNHPLAGKNLTFTVFVKAIEKA